MFGANIVAVEDNGGCSKEYIEQMNCVRKVKDVASVKHEQAKDVGESILGAKESEDEQKISERVAIEEN